MSKLVSFFGAFCLFVFFNVSHAAQSSRSVVTSDDQQTLYTANFDAGSLSKINLDNAYQRTSVILGKDIRRLALSADNRLLAATDYLSNKVFLLDADTLEIKHQVHTGNRPFAVVYDNNREIFWVSLFENNRLIGITRRGKIKHNIEVADTPRGLAMTDDNRLLITHAMTGEISIYALGQNSDAGNEQPELIKRIRLQETQKTDQFKSQGLPRLLDDIAISPDGKEAWLPHVLWNFDHPFQFQSTIFPAISVLDIQPGQEGEKTALRKELFKQINIIDNNRTRIVSNPADAEFSTDGKRLFITLAGSEDLMVIDLSRRSTKKKKRSRRRRGKLNQGGAKVTQILRHLPGDNPRGLVVVADRLYVQNAMSQDVSLLDASEKGPFARVKIQQAQLFKTVDIDPLSPELRAGTQLFHSANTDDFPEFPMTGDFWMSCNSCHLDGFNFTNRYLIEDGKAGKDRFMDSVTGHQGVIKMIAGNPSAALAEIIQKTQGGLGADPQQENIKPVDPHKLPETVESMIQALKAYIIKQENLPYLSTWLRLEDDRRFNHKKEWLNSASCAGCHETIFDQWANSNHGAMMDHPYYRFQENYAAQQEGEPFRALCRGCHFPQAVLTNEVMPQHTMANMYEKNGASLKAALDENRPVVEAGTGCLFCHRIVKAENAGGNADLTVNLKDRESYVFEDSGSTVTRWMSERMINAKPAIHKASYSNPTLYQDSLYCATCHNEFTPGPGAQINDNYGEWLASSWNNPEDPSKHRTCIDCHMHADTARLGEDIPGRSTDGGPVKANVRTHHFTGANHYLAGLRSQEHATISETLLKEAATVNMSLTDNELVVSVTNANGGHHLPGGSRRQMWLEVTAVDANGNTVLKNGHLTEKGHVPIGARQFHKVGGDQHGNKVGLSFWRVEKILEDTRIPADSKRDEVFRLPENTAYPIDVTSRLLFRAFSRELTDKVREAFPDEHIPYAPVIEMQSLTRQFGLESTSQAFVH